VDLTSRRNRRTIIRMKSSTRGRNFDDVKHDGGSISDSSSAHVCDSLLRLSRHRKLAIHSESWKALNSQHNLQNSRRSPSPHFYTVESSSNDSDCSSSKGRRRFRLLRKKKFDVTPNKHGQVNVLKKTPSEISFQVELVIELTESLICEHQVDCGSSEVSSLSCLDDYIDEGFVGFNIEQQMRR
jgi:hypothetical protein